MRGAYLKVELSELLLGVNVGVSRHDYGTSGERHLSIRRLAVIRGGGGQTAVVSELLVQNGGAGGGMARRRRLDLTDVVQAQQKRQYHDAEDQDAAGAAAQYFVHDSTDVTRVDRLHDRSR